MKKLLALLIALSTLAHAGLPPTTTKGAADAANVTTFNYLFPGHPVTHSGTNATILSPTPVVANFIGQTTTWAPTNTADRDLEASIGNWLAFADAAAATPVDLTGGSPTTTCTRSTTTPLDGAASLLVTKDAANRQGEGCSVVFNVQPAYQGATATITAALNISSGSIVQGDVKLFVYDVTNSLLITPFNNDVIAGPTLTATFPLTARAATPANQQYRLGIYFASTAATAVTLQLDDFSVSPGQAAYGLAGSNWTAYTPTLSASFGTTSGSSFYYRRSGDSIDIRGYFVAGTTTAARGTMTIPSPLALDTTKGADIGAGLRSLNCTYTRLDVTGPTAITSADHIGSLTAWTGTAGTSLLLFNSRGQTGTYADTNINSLISSGDGIAVNCNSIPIVGFDASVTMASSSQFKISSYLANGTRVTGSAPTALGQYRSYLRNAGAATYSETNGTPTATPNPTDGIKLYTASTFAAADPSNSPSAYDIFVGKNKNVRVDFYSSSGRTGTAIVNNYVSSTTDVGTQYSYDPTTGVVTINGFVTGSTNVRLGNAGLNVSSLTSLYFDIVVSENALSVGVDTKNITSNNSNERVERVNVAAQCTSSPCTIASQSGSWVSSITRSGTGVYAVNINSGIFSAAPTCVCSAHAGASVQICNTGPSANTSTLVALGAVNTTNNTNIDITFDVLCMGPR